MLLVIIYHMSDTEQSVQAIYKQLTLDKFTNASGLADALALS